MTINKPGQYSHTIGFNNDLLAWVSGAGRLNRDDFFFVDNDIAIFPHSVGYAINHPAVVKYNCHIRPP